MITVPKKAFEQPGDDGEVIAPSVGDEVNRDGVVFTVKAEKGDSLDVEVSSINGIEVASCAKPEAEADDEGMAEFNRMAAEDNA